MSDAVWDVWTPSVQVEGKTVSALYVEPNDLWPTARMAGRVEEIASAEWVLKVEAMGAHSVRIGVLQTANTSPRTGENWFDSKQVGSAWYVGGGLFSGNVKQKSVATSATRSGVLEGDVVGVHVRGHLVSFSKNGQPIPGSMRRGGTLQLAVQLCSPGDSVSVLSSSGKLDYS